MNIKNFYILQIKSLSFYASEVLHYAAESIAIYAPQRLQSVNAKSFAFMFKFIELHHILGHKS